MAKGYDKGIYLQNLISVQQFEPWEIFGEMLMNATDSSCYIGVKICCSTSKQVYSL